MCTNCLKTDHDFKACGSGNCRTCNGRHHTLLHIPKASDTNSIVNHEATTRQHSVNPFEPGPSNALTSVVEGPHVLLSTAIVYIRDSAGNQHKCRALLDSGSQSHFMSAACARRIQLKGDKINIAIKGIGGLTSTVKEQVHTMVKSRFNAFQKPISCLVVAKIAGKLPAVPFNSAGLDIPKHIKLSDPTFNLPGDIDLLIGAGLFWQLLCVGQITLNAPGLVLQKTHFGWTILGHLPTDVSTPVATHCHFNQSLDKTLRRFWEIEEAVSPEITASREEHQCQRHFTRNLITLDRFIVSLPHKSSVESLGDNLQVATKQLYALEKRLAKNPRMKLLYHQFLEEYQNLGHMTQTTKTYGYYLPHHGIMKEDSTTTKLRVVFNASAKSDTGLSLNDTLMVGPQLQRELFDILLSFRTHKYPLVADIEKMYRQLWINERDRLNQRILWRFSEEEEIKAYTLNAVTYGTAPPSFLAIRCLQEACRREFESYPEAAQVGLRDFYVDDLLTGANSERDLHEIKTNLTTLLSKYGFKLRKFNSNHQNIMGADSLINISEMTENNDTAKTLGLIWDVSRDQFQFKSVVANTQRVTKRTMLSSIASIYDPLGIIAPITIKAKVLMQRLWQLKTEWDEAVPQDVHSTWQNYVSQLNCMSSISVPRHIMRGSPTELHGFCDASETAYGACLYLKSLAENEQTFTFLVCAKSRVAPLKTVTIPRLELCGALLLRREHSLATISLGSIGKHM